MQMNKEWQIIKEGNTEFEMFIDAERIYDASVFYNPKMVLNRDLTLLVIETLLRKKEILELRFLDLFAGTGIRSFRILNEISKEKINRIAVNDINPKAIEIIKKNKKRYPNSELLEVFQQPALKLLAEYVTKKPRPNVIDLDPFGSPIEYIDIALHALDKKKGFLFATATDLQVLCGKFKDACLRQYNALPTRNYWCHEIALRIMLYNTILSAGRAGYLVEPILSYHFEHFIRIHVKISKKREEANKQHKKIGFVYYCGDCSYFRIEPFDEISTEFRCARCDNLLKKAGPMWLGELYDKELIEQMALINNNKDLQSKKQIDKMLKYLKEEHSLPPLFYYVPYLKKQFNTHCNLKISEIVEKLITKGFAASRTIFNPNSVKTNAPYEVLKEIIEKN
ncbi:MAG: tRNA (guanine(10)-N(2))-dimethyltransferase [Candidatus Heimdallarchaeaceae archaeon]